MQRKTQKSRKPTGDQTSTFWVFFCHVYSIFVFVFWCVWIPWQYYSATSRPGIYTTMRSGLLCGQTHNLFTQSHFVCLGLVPNNSLPHRATFCTDEKSLNLWPLNHVWKSWKKKKSNKPQTRDKEETPELWNQDPLHPGMDQCVQWSVSHWCDSLIWRSDCSHDNFFLN